MGDKVVLAGGQRATMDAPKNEILGTGHYTMTTDATDGEDGSCAVQLVLKDAEGNDLSAPVSGLLYLSEVATGLTHDLADTSLAELTNGAITNIGGAGPSLFTTDAEGKLGLTITAADDDYWVVLVLPDGGLLISDKCVVSGNI